jgi:ATP-dependent protease ClpP protease subunit
MIQIQEREGTKKIRSSFDKKTTNTTPVELTIPAGQLLEYIGPVSNSLNEKIFAEVKERMRNNPTDEIFITVTSTGGPSGSAMSFFDVVRHMLKPKLSTIGSGDVDSSGVIIFLTGERRYISPRTTMLLHLAGRKFDPHTRYTADEMEAMAREDRLKDMQYATVVANASHILSVPEVLDLMKRNTILSPEELITYGLAHAMLP